METRSSPFSRGIRRARSKRRRLLGAHTTHPPALLRGTSRLHLQPQGWAEQALLAAPASLLPQARFPEVWERRTSPKTVQRTN